ncbi:MAG TPA: transcription antitermination factor NusB [Candidatus Saccharimonadales bacterium]|nr:transcription antitermination factor NusB [Candidatus Saccharimonadales bacterium]
MKKFNDKRHSARVVALQALFEWSFNSVDVEKIANRNLETNLSDSEETVEKEVDLELVNFLLKGTTENLDNIDKIIEKAAPEWPLEQIAKVDLEVLRISIFELYIARSVPPKVAIDEAVELGKEFGGENSSKFINGVLGTVVKELMPEVDKESAKKHSKK